MPRLPVAALLHAAVLPTRSPLLVWRHSRVERAYWLPARLAAKPGGRPPLVSALMITRNRPRLAMVAIECFRAQTWPHRELVIVDHGAGTDLARHLEGLRDPRIRHIRLGRSCTPIGTLRNRSLAEARGDWMCQWDDDDLSHPGRIAMQMTAAAAVDTDACVLFRETLWRPRLDQVAWTAPRLWEHSLLARRAIVPAFPPLRRGSDTPVVAAIAARGPVALLDEPRLYVHAGRTGGVSIHGNRSLQNNFMLDGVDNNSISTNVQELSTQVSRPSIDAIGEFKVVTSPFTAEYGRAAGGAIVVTTKSGSNRFGGTVYGFLRNEGFDAKNYFAEKANLDKAKNDQKQFGGNIGGPLVRNRAFFFADFEGTRVQQGVLRASTVMTDAQRSGVFTSAIKDPLTGVNFANNTIPNNRIDPVAAAILGLLPSPNASGSTNYVIQPNVQDEGERYLGRVDLKAGTNDSLFARFIYTDRLRFVPGFLGGVLDGTSTSAWGRNFLKSKSVVAGWTRVLKESLVNEFRASWANGESDGQQDPFGNDGLAQIGFKGVPANPAVLGGIVGIDITGHARLGSPNFMPKYQHTNQFQFLNTTTWLSGNHQLKFGADIMAPMNNQYLDVPSTRGNLSFTGQFTGHAFADFLLGYARGAELSNVNVVNQRRWAMAYFLQDDWRINSNLTLNLGVRYDFMTPSYEKDNRMANFDPATGGLVFASDGSLHDRTLVKPDWNNVAPRVGLVYQIDSNTIVRGGYGIFYNSLDRIGSEDQLALNPPNLRNINQTTTSTTTPVLFLRDGFPPNYLDANNIVLSRLLIRAANPDGGSAMFQQMSAGLERQIGHDVAISVDVVGNFGKDIAVLRNLNQPASGNGARPYPNFSHIQWRDQSGTSPYYGMDLSAEKRFSDGYTARLSYTLSDARDQAPEHLAASSGRQQNTNDLEAWEGPSDFDVRHRLVATFVAELPFGTGKPYLQDGVGAAVLGGWTVSGIYTARSGRPFTVTQGTLEGATWMPNQTGDPNGDKTVDRWFNAGAFTRVNAGVFGDTKRNSLVGSGYVALDLTVQRKFMFNDRYAASLRWDMFNVFNRANFGNPNSNITATNVGTISTLAGDPRQMQVSFRLHF